MKKEIAIILTIIIIVITTNYFAQRFTEKSIKQLEMKLEELSEEIDVEEDNQGNSKTKKLLDIFNELEQVWVDNSKILTLYLEHNEIENIDTNLVNISVFIANEQYDNMEVEIENCKYILNHVNEKYKMSFKNIL